MKVDAFRRHVSCSFYPRALRTGRWHFRATRSMCAITRLYRLSSATERPSPEECLQDLSKQLLCRPALRILCTLFTVQKTATPPFLFPDALCLRTDTLYRHFCGCKTAPQFSAPHLHSWICTLSGLKSTGPLAQNLFHCLVPPATIQ